jgi:steroid delta-isomerase-like uncharacterized protein
MVTMNSTDQLEFNKRVVMQYVDAFNRGDPEALLKLFSKDALIYGVLGWGGVDAVMPIWRELHEAFAMTLNIESIIAEGNHVTARYTERGTFVKPFRGQEPTGKSSELVAMEWFVLQDGKIERRWGARDHASQARQMGLKLS